MSQPTFCSSCTSIFEGTYVTLYAYLQHEGQRLRDSPRRNFWQSKEINIKLNAPDLEGIPALHFHHTKTSLSTSRQTCVFCALVWDQLEQLPEFLEISDLITDEDIGIPCVITSPGQYSAWGPFVLGFIYARPGPDNTLLANYVFELRNLDAIDMTLLDNTSKWASDFDRARSLARLKTWLSEETPMPAVQVTASLPTRLLELSTTQDQDAPVRLRLRDTSGLDSATRYAAVSHCWGEKQPLKLLEELLSEFLTNIPMSKMPKTFQDVIKLASSLDIRYVWIDSLCIIQDSKEDWEQEAALMASVYLNACVTISATAAKDSSAGTLPMSMMRFPCLITPTWTGFKRLEELKTFRLVDHGSYSRRVIGRPLFRRGWIYQEWLLSRRTIHCASDQLWWSSLWDEEGFVANETCTGHEFDLLQLHGIAQMMSPSKLLKYVPGGTSGTIQTPSRVLWNDLVRDYTCRLFTFDSDRLIAFSGIASVYQQVNQLPEEQYLAGLWRYTLLEDLLWTSRDGRRACPPQQYRAPSWSWASMEPIHSLTHRFSVGHVDSSSWSEERQMGSTVIRVLDTNVETPGSRFGSALDGYITFQGPLIKAVLTNKVVDLSHQLGYDGVKEFFPGGVARFVISTLLLPNAEQNIPEAERTPESITKFDLDDASPWSGFPDPPEAYTVYLGIFKCYESDSPVYGQALVLMKCGKRGEFRRIGCTDLGQTIAHLRIRHGDFGAYDILDSGDYLGRGDEPGHYVYRVV